MSASDKWGSYTTPCPDCGGEVEFWSFGSDDSYSQGSSGIQCKGCKRNFTREVWEKIAYEELKDEIEARKKRKRESDERAEKIKTIRRNALAKLTDEEIMAFNGMGGILTDQEVKERGIDKLLQKRSDEFLKRRW